MDPPLARKRIRGRHVSVKRWLLKIGLGWVTDEGGRGGILECKVNTDCYARVTKYLESGLEINGIMSVEDKLMIFFIIISISTLIKEHVQRKIHM